MTLNLEKCKILFYSTLCLLLFSNIVNAQGWAPKYGAPAEKKVEKKIEAVSGEVAKDNKKEDNFFIPTEKESKEELPLRNRQAGGMAQGVLLPVGSLSDKITNSPSADATDMDLPLKSRRLRTPMISLEETLNFKDINADSYKHLVDNMKNQGFDISEDQATRVNQNPYDAGSAFSEITSSLTPKEFRYTNAKEFEKSYRNISGTKDKMEDGVRRSLKRVENQTGLKYTEMVAEKNKIRNMKLQELGFSN